MVSRNLVPRFVGAAARRPGLMAVAAAAALAACGGGDGGGDGTTGSPGGGAPLTLASPETGQLLNAFAYQFGLSQPTLMIGPSAAGVAARSGEGAADGGAAADPGTELRPLAGGAETVPCPGGGSVSRLDGGGFVALDFANCMVPSTSLGMSSAALNGTATVTAGPVGATTVQMDLVMRSAGQEMRLRFEDLGIDEHGGACNHTVTMRSGAMEGSGAGGGYAAEWRNIRSEMRPDGVICTWHVDGRFISNGVFALDGGPPLPPVRHDITIQTLEPLRYGAPEPGSRLNLPMGGRVLLESVPTGQRVSFRMADGGVYLGFNGAEAEDFVSYADFLERVRRDE